MEKIMFATKLNGTNQSGLINIATKEVFCLCDIKVANEILGNMKKAKSLDDLEEKISAFYPEDENEETGDLCDMGEVVATHFGYL